MQGKGSRKNYHNNGHSPETWGMVLGSPPTSSPCSARTLALRYGLRPTDEGGGRADVEGRRGETGSRVWARRRRRWVREGRCCHFAAWKRKGEQRLSLPGVQAHAKPDWQRVLGLHGWFLFFTVNTGKSACCGRKNVICPLHVILGQIEPLWRHDMT